MGLENRHPETPALRGVGGPGRGLGRAAEGTPRGPQGPHTHPLPQKQGQMRLCMGSIHRHTAGAPHGDPMKHLRDSTLGARDQKDPRDCNEIDGFPSVCFYQSRRDVGSLALGSRDRGSSKARDQVYQPDLKRTPRTSLTPLRQKRRQIQLCMGSNNRQAKPEKSVKNAQKTGWTEYELSYLVFFFFNSEDARSFHSVKNFTRNNTLCGRRACALAREGYMMKQAYECVQPNR